MQRSNFPQSSFLGHFDGLPTNRQLDVVNRVLSDKSRVASVCPESGQAVPGPGPDSTLVKTGVEQTRPTKSDVQDRATLRQSVRLPPGAG